jgi:hypothetical protein
MMIEEVKNDALVQTSNEQMLKLWGDHVVVSWQWWLGIFLEIKLVPNFT